MVLVPFLFPASPCGVTIDHIAKSASKDHEREDQEDDWWHTVILYFLVYVSDTRFAFNGYGMVTWRTFPTLFLHCQLYPTVPLAPAREKHDFTIRRPLPIN
jgi:hypothetical protein